MKKLIEIAENQIEKLVERQNNATSTIEVFETSNMIKSWVHTIRECKNIENDNSNRKETQLQLSEVTNKLVNNINKMLPN